MKEKKKSTLSKLMVFAGNHKYYVYASCILATISAFMALVPFYDIWRIIKEVLEVRPHFNTNEEIIYAISSPAFDERSRIVDISSSQGSLSVVIILFSSGNI